MLTSKQRAYLRGLANSLEPVLMVGKEGITENLIAQAYGVLEKRELINGKVLENSNGDDVTVPLAGLVNRVGKDLKKGVLTALDIFRTEDNARALTHTVRTF